MNRGDALILLAAFIWGIAYYYQKVAMLHIGPLLFLGMRCAVAALTLIPIALLGLQRDAFSSTQQGGYMYSYGGRCSFN